MLPIKNQEFIKNEMKILLESINSKLSENVLSPHRNQLESAISFFINAIHNQNKSGYLYNGDSFQPSPAEVEINNYSAELSKVLSNTDAASTLDSLRHAFSSYARNGLHELFTCQENEGWHPQVILDEELRPNDINILPNLITLYRGTDITEHNSSNYGQSWSTNKEIAYLFAFKHYLGQPWFNANQRVILKTNISKEHAYFSNQSGEFEVVINARKISHVEIA
ncbi:hypothetical protein N5D53_20245 [Pseudomonas sp. GD03862]|uniref:hypothetical protein n=1 Tax=Pseudomonas sp. GD03862 TaxID=2975391 RepID=UPI00244C1AED|nr:hypothetical protein [Pseudomonas sp. GD03862]MDH0708850.1 hypothetical protein [Pseudomonas sp. GD03862]